MGIFIKAGAKKGPFELTFATKKCIIIINNVNWEIVYVPDLEKDG